MRACLICGDPNGAEHHSLPKGAWPEHRNDPACLIPLCFYCHNDWHDGRVPVYREDLPPETWALIERSASPEWCDKWYPSRPHADLPF